MYLHLQVLQLSTSAKASEKKVAGGGSKSVSVYSLMPRIDIGDVQKAKEIQQIDCGYPRGIDR